MFFSTVTIESLALIKYPVWVGGTQVTGENMNDIPGVTGTAKYDPLKKKLTFTLKITEVLADKKLKSKKHRAVQFESTNKNVATVTAKGVIKAKKKGTCFVYAYAQNGVMKKIKVTVK